MNHDDPFLAQVKRLSCMKGFSTLTPESINELADTLENACHGQEGLGDRVISEFTALPSGAPVPTPGDIRTQAWQVQHPEVPWEQPREPRCSLCGDSGWIIRERTVEPFPGMKYRTSSAERCKCKNN